MKKFLFRCNDDIAYINFEDLKKKSLCCDNCFNIVSPNYSKSFKLDNDVFDDELNNDVLSILSIEELKMLAEPKDNDLTDIINKLEKEEYTELYEQFEKEELEYIANIVGTDEEEAEKIVDNYCGEYIDRNIILQIYKDDYDLGQDYADLYISGLSDNFKQYFDYESFGEDISNEGEQFYTLDDNRIIEYCY